MKVSVLMPTYNRSGKFLAKAIESFLNQDYKNSELAILNNGSTDNTLNYLMNTYGNNNRIKIFTRDKNDTNTSLNFLWNNATGDLICLLFDDDLLTKNSISERVKPFFYNSFIEVIYSGWRNINIDGKVLSIHGATSPNPYLSLNKEYINFTTMMWKNDLKHKFMFDESFHYNMDTIFKIRCMMECCVIAINEPLVNYTIHSTQATNTMPSDVRINELNSVKQKIKELYKL